MCLNPCAASRSCPCFFSPPPARHTPPKVAPENPVVVDEVRLEGFDPLPVEVREELADDLPLRAGVTLTDELEKTAGERAVEILQNHGHPYAQVGIAREPIDPARARVIVRAEPGTIGFFGPVEIAGNKRVDDRIIRRRLAYVPGDLFRRSAIEQTQQRIGALGLFKSVEIRAQNIDRQPAFVPTLVTVEEQTPWQWNLGAGVRVGRASGRRRAHQPSERSRFRAAHRSARTCLGYRARGRVDVHAERLVASRALAVAASAAPGDR